MPENGRGWRPKPAPRNEAMLELGTKGGAEKRGAKLGTKPLWSCVTINLGSVERISRSVEGVLWWWEFWIQFGCEVGVETRISLRRPGLSDLSPRVFRPPMVWTASPVSDVSLYGEFISVSRFDAWPSDIRWGGDHRYPLTTGCNRFEPNVFPPGHALVMRLAVRVPDDTLQEVQYHRKKQRLLASKNDCCGLRGGRKPHPDFKIAGGMRTRGARAWEAVEKTGQNIFNSW